MYDVDNDIANMVRIVEGFLAAGIADKAEKYADMAVDLMETRRLYMRAAYWGADADAYQAEIERVADETVDDDKATEDAVTAGGTDTATEPETEIAEAETESQSAAPATIEPEEISPAELRERAEGIRAQRYERAEEIRSQLFSEARAQQTGYQDQKFGAPWGWPFLKPEPVDE